MRIIRFTLPKPTPTLNQLQRRHFHARSNDKKKLSWEIRCALGVSRPAAPFARAHVLIERFSTGTPDRDNLFGGVKDLVDCLLDQGIRMVNGLPVALHPTGLGLILDDSPKHMMLEVFSRSPGRGMTARTVVTITEMGPEPPAQEPAS